MERLEKIEQICLTILAEEPRAWVPFSYLVERCKSVLNEEKLNEQMLLDFLNSHPEIMVMEPFGENSSEFKALIGNSKVKIEPVVILKKRLPRTSDLLDWFRKRLDELVQTLSSLAENEKNEMKRESTYKILHKATELKCKIEKMLEGKKKVE